MSYDEQSRTSGRRALAGVLTCLVAAAALAAALGGQALPDWVSAAAPPSVVGPPSDHRLPGGDRGHGEADGVVPDGVTVFDDEYPAVANLDPALASALRRAATAAAEDGVELEVNSGWRSADYQDRLLAEAVAEHGSEEEAARWVATADTSSHVSGDAVDIGPIEATEWLSEHGAGYGLCRTYDNEPWHHELRPDAVHHGCPPRYADPAHDPRLQS